MQLTPYREVATTMSNPLLAARARIAALSRSRPKDDPELIEAYVDLADAKITAAIERAVAAAPKLSAEQRERLHAIIDGSDR